MGRRRPRCIQGTDVNEKPMSGVTVTLKNNNGEVIGTTTTDDKGYYEFTGLENGDYTVEFETPEGYQETPTGQGTDEGKDSNEKVVNVTINGADNMTIDKGFFKEEPTTPEEPGTPDEPNTPPTTPEEPGTPDEPSTPPTTPEEPGTPDEPNTPPTTPEEPGTPDEPNTPPTTPEEPGTPDEPNTPPTTPGEPNTPATTAGEPNSTEASSEGNGSTEKETALPDTGSNNSNQNTTLFGSLLAAVGLSFLVRRRRKEDK
ncbi:SdrD B-like domain-containing protein [Staphylococcus sp. 11261D007BR]